MSATFYGRRLKADKERRIVEHLKHVGHQHEHVELVARASKIRPMLDRLVVTNHRVIGFDAGEVKQVVDVTDMAGVQIRSVMRNQELVLQTGSGTRVGFGMLERDDVPAVEAAVQQLFARGPTAWASEVAPIGADARRVQEQWASESRTQFWQGIICIPTRPSNKAGAVVEQNSRDGEKPWFVLDAGQGGVLAAWDDRLMVIKTGGLTSALAGSMGGGRLATFHFPDITGIEFNSGLVNGVLEVLTASYSGTANKDFWRGLGNTNPDSNDPFQLSNTVPMDRGLYQLAQPQLNELRARIADSKRLRVVVPPQPTTPPAVSVTEDLTRLATLHVAGALSDAEFQQAKERLLQRL